MVHLKHVFKIKTKSEIVIGKFSTFIVDVSCNVEERWKDANMEKFHGLQAYDKLSYMEKQE